MINAHRLAANKLQPQTVQRILPLVGWSNFPWHELTWRWWRVWRDWLCLPSVSPIRMHVFTIKWFISHMMEDYSSCFHNSVHYLLQVEFWGREESQYKHRWAHLWTEWVRRDLNGSCLQHRTLIMDTLSDAIHWNGVMTGFYCRHQIHNCVF